MNPQKITMKTIKTPEKIVKEHYHCTCDKMYKIRKKTDPTCILCEHGGEMESIAKDYHAQFSISIEEFERAKNTFIRRWRLSSKFDEYMIADLNALLSMRPEEKEEQWINIKDELPESGIEVLLFNEKWINEDWNPKGMRIGFLDDVAGWVSSYWCNYHDEYHTRTTDEDDHQFEDFKAENQIPTHWMPLPEFNPSK
jgi:hypothetical protein